MPGKSDSESIRSGLLPLVLGAFLFLTLTIMKQRTEIQLWKERAEKLLAENKRLRLMSGEAVRKVERLQDRRDLPDMSPAEALAYGLGRFMGSGYADLARAQNNTVRVLASE